MSGKGDSYRPCDRKKFEEGYELAFGKETEQAEVEVEQPKVAYGTTWHELVILFKIVGIATIDAILLDLGLQFVVKPLLEGMGTLASLAILSGYFVGIMLNAILLALWLTKSKWFE